jgi:putative ABC transport system permease protein
LVKLLLSPYRLRMLLPHTPAVGEIVALLLGGIWWRRWASVVLVLCASITVAGAAAGPLWGHASQASLLARALQDSPVSEIAWTVAGSTASYEAKTMTPPPPSVVASTLRTLSQLPPGLDGLFDETTQMVATARRLQVQPVRKGPKPAPTAPKPVLPLGRLVGREGACEQVELTSGSCPATDTDLLLSDRSAKDLGVVPGSRVEFPELEYELKPPTTKGLVKYTVTGLYRAETVRTASRFWFDSEDFDYTPLLRIGPKDTMPANLDAVLVKPDLVLSIKSIEVRVQQERVLRPGAVTLADADRVAQQLTRKDLDLEATSRTAEATANAAATISGTLRGRDLVADTATFVGLQVVVFGWVVLFGLVAISVGARDGELALAKLRGLRGRALAAHALVEPITLVLVAVPVGLIGAWVAVDLLAHQVLLPGTSVTIPSGVWAAVGATAAGSVLACALAARRSVRMPVADQLRRQSPPAGTAGPIASAVLMTLAVVGVVLALSLGRGAQAALPALLTPVVVGLAAGLVVGYAVQVVLRALVTRTHRWSLGPYLAVRQLARQSSLTRITALVTVATAVSGFAAGAYVVTAQQRETQARIDVGAERVVHVGALKTSDLIAAGRKVDPQGRWAMAAVQRGEGAATLIAVDSPRLGISFGVPRGSLDRIEPLPELLPANIPEPLEVRGDTVTIKVASTYLLVTEDVVARLQLRVRTPDGDVNSTTLGALDHLGGKQTLTAPLPACAEGCTVVSVFVTRDSATTDLPGTVELASLDIGGRSYPFSVQEWRPAGIDEGAPDSAATSTLGPPEDNQGGLVMRFGAAASVTPGMVRRDVPTELPAVVGEQTPLNLLGARKLVEGSRLDGGHVPFSIAGRTPVLLRATGGALVDLTLASRITPKLAPGLDFQVWLGESAPADAPAQLAAAGLKVKSVESRADRRTELDRAEPARAQLLLLGAGAAVLLAGVAGIATVLAAAARRRAVESAALHAMAVPGRVVRSSAVLEDVLLLLPGLLTGAVCAVWLLNVLEPLLAEVTGAGTAVAGIPKIVDVMLPVLAATLVTALLLVPVVLVATRPAADEAPLRAAT